MQHSFLADKKYKIIWIGDSGVGKTCLLTKALKNFFDQELKSTLGFEYHNITININDKKILLETWDTCGQESFKCIVNMFYKRAKLAILVYSIDNRKSFEGINFWLNELRINSGEQTKLILIGNKTDLDDKREVSYEEGKNFSQLNGFNFFSETSAKEGEAPLEVLTKAAEILYNYEKECKDKKDKDKNNNEINNNIENKNFKLGECNENANNNNTTSCKNCL
jgi:small GTP-binding protein